MALRSTATLPKRVKIIFSDLDGTLVHFEKHFQPQGIIQSQNDEEGTAIYQCEEGPSRGETRSCRLLPTLTMGPGLFSEKSSDLIHKLREAGVVFVYVTGARKSTMLKRLPLLAPADYAVAETGGRMYKLEGGTNNESPVLDDEWTAKISAVCGPIENDMDLPLDKRSGVLWDWCRELTSKGVPCDTINYTCCFRVDCKKQPGSEATLTEALDRGMPPGVSCAQNLGKFDFFPDISGKGNAVEYLLAELGVSKDDAVALFDDENDLPMANACGHACVMRCTHESIAAHLPKNPHWHVATETGVLATEEILEMLLENASASS